MSGRFAAEHAAVFLELLQHVTVADVGAQERHAELAHRALEPEVAHQRADQRTAQAAAVACQSIAST